VIADHQWKTVQLEDRQNQELLALTKQILQLTKQVRSHADTVQREDEQNRELLDLSRQTLALTKQVNSRLPAHTATAVTPALRNPHAPTRERASRQAPLASTSSGVAGHDFLNHLPYRAAVTPAGRSATTARLRASRGSALLTGALAFSRGGCSVVRGHSRGRGAGSDVDA
jgi:hypothetical protein